MMLPTCLHLRCLLTRQRRTSPSAPTTHRSSKPWRGLPSLPLPTGGAFAAPIASPPTTAIRSGVGRSLVNHERAKRNADSMSRPRTAALPVRPQFMIRIHQLGQDDRNIQVNDGVLISAVIEADRKYLRACSIPMTWYRIGDWCVPDNEEATRYPGLALRRVYLRPHQECL
jgi:hypothetical protein